MTSNYKVTHILREGNSSTDFMAVGGSKNIEAEYIMGTYFSAVRSY